MATPQILCRNLACGYHGRSVLSEINLELFRGQSVALLGLNGSGKSTLLKTISGDLEPLSGTIEIQTESDLVQPSHLSPDRCAKLMATVPQEESSAFGFTALETVTMGRLAGARTIFDSKEDGELAMESMRTVECEHLAQRYITELSGGEKQRVLIARALAQSTPNVVLDEPTSHLDPPHQTSIAKLIRHLAQEGRCMITAVHDLNLAAILADFAILVGSGKIIEQGEIESMLGSPALEECYRTKFERVRTDSGRLVLVPGI